MYFTLYFINHSILCIWFLFFKNFSYFIKKVKWVYIKLWLMEHKINKTKKKWDKEFLFFSKHNNMMLFFLKLMVATINGRGERTHITIFWEHLLISFGYEVMLKCCAYSQTIAMKSQGLGYYLLHSHYINCFIGLQRCIS